MGKIASGIADNSVTTLCASTSKNKLIIAPAMNLKLYMNKFFQENLNKLRGLGATIVEPRMEGGIAKVALVEEVVDHAVRKLSMSRLKGRRVLILNGPTRYDLDAIRFISNKATGMLGYWLAKEAFYRGCNVKVIHGPDYLSYPRYLETISVYTTEDMLKESVSEVKREKYDVVMFPAAILDFKPEETLEKKVESGREWMIRLKPAPKVIDEVAKWCRDSFIVAFKLEYRVSEEKLIEEAYKRLKEVNAGLIVANDASEIRGERHKAYIINRRGEVREFDGTKRELAYEILNALEKEF